MLLVKSCSVAELDAASNMLELLEEYAAEAAIGGLPHPSVKKEAYYYLESVGGIATFGAFLDDILIGFITVLAPEMPHYSAKVAVGESFFVAKAHRKTGAGLRLLHAAENYAKASGSLGLLVSAPFGGNLAEVLPHVGYIETNRVFFKAVEL